MWLHFWSLLLFPGLAVSSTTNTCDHTHKQLPSAKLSFSTVAAVVAGTNTTALSSRSTAIITIASQDDVQGAGEPTNERTTRESETTEKTTAKSSTVTTTAPTTTSASGCWDSKPCLQAIDDLAAAYDIMAMNKNLTDPNEHDTSEKFDPSEVFQDRFCSEYKYEE